MVEPYYGPPDHDLDISDIPDHPPQAHPQSEPQWPLTDHDLEILARYLAQEQYEHHAQQHLSVLQQAITTLQQTHHSLLGEVEGLLRVACGILCEVQTARLLQAQYNNNTDLNTPSPDNLQTKKSQFNGLQPQIETQNRVRTQSWGQTQPWSQTNSHTQNQTQSKGSGMDGIQRQWKAAAWEQQLRQRQRQRLRRRECGGCRLVRRVPW